MTTTTPSPARVGLPHPGELSRSQKLMVFVLSMTTFGLANIITEVLPSIQLGPIELSISYLAFVPVVMVSLFHPLWAALGAPLGEIIFVDLLMGNFSGIGELEGYIQLALGLYIGGSLVRDPLRKWQVALAAFVAVFIDKVLGGITDIVKVLIGVADAEFVEGLPESILVLEAVEQSVDIVISGILFGAIPAMLLAPRLHGRIEPLLGMAPRTPEVPVAQRARISAPFVILALVLGLVSVVAAILDELDLNGIVLEGEFVENYGPQVLWISVGVALTILVIAILVARSRATSSIAASSSDIDDRLAAAAQAPATVTTEPATAESSAVESASPVSTDSTDK